MSNRVNLADGAKIIARNRCRNCSHEWYDKPMGFASLLVCPECHSEYWVWVNYRSSADN